MNKVFNLENGGEVNALKHTLEILRIHPDAKIYVGCDSQNKKRYCIYSTVIAYRYSYGESGLRKAAGFIYYKENVDKIRDKFTRLWGEVDRSVELAKWLQENGIDVYQIDLDFNEDCTAGSNDMVAVGRGYVIGNGFQCSIKPEQQCASRCADHIVKKKGNRRPHHFVRRKGKKKNKPS